jgi:superfamily II DNA or RNA helicase
MRIDDCRVTGTDHEFTCATELRPEQAVAVRHLATQDTGVMIAPPGSGKTVIACAAIASRRTSALILVDRKALADQWRDRLHKHLGVKCGQIGGGRSKTTGIIDVALLPTLARRENVEEITSDYGFVIVDECHHIAAAAFSAVLNRIPAKYWLGLTATPERRDGLEDLVGFEHEVRVVLDAKCAHAGIAMPTLESMRATVFRTEVEAEWGNMLGH